MDELSSQALNNSVYQSELSSLESLFAKSETLDEGQKFLRFQLCPNNTALLAVNEVTAVLTIMASDILPVPHMPACVLGIYNWRGEVLWLTNLAGQIGFDRANEPDLQLTSFMAIVVQLEGQLLGLAVPEVYDIEQHDPQHLHSSPDLFPPNLSPFMTGYLMSDRSTVLNVAAILQDPQLHIHGLN